MELFFRNLLIGGVLAFLIFKLFKLYRKSSVKLMRKRQDSVSSSDRRMEKLHKEFRLSGSDRGVENPPLKQNKKKIKKAYKEDKPLGGLDFLLDLSRSTQRSKRSQGNLYLLIGGILVFLIFKLVKLYRKSSVKLVRKEQDSMSGSDNSLEKTSQAS